MGHEEREGKGHLGQLAVVSMKLSYTSIAVIAAMAASPAEVNGNDVIRIYAANNEQFCSVHHTRQRHIHLTWHECAGNVNDDTMGQRCTLWIVMLYANVSGKVLRVYLVPSWVVLSMQEWVA